MATCGNQSPEQEKDVKDTFYDIDACSTTPLSILLENDLTTIIDALDMRYGKGQSTDRIQQEFYQLSQE